MRIRDIATNGFEIVVIEQLEGKVMPALGYDRLVDERRPLGYRPHGSPSGPACCNQAFVGHGKFSLWTDQLRLIYGQDRVVPEIDQICQLIKLVLAEVDRLENDILLFVQVLLNISGSVDHNAHIYVFVLDIQENGVTRKARILVIEDEDTIRTLITSALEQLGHDVIEAENGQVAERYLDEDRFDLVITDLIMPERDGLEVIRDLRANHPDTRILAASTPSTLMLLEIAKLMGAHATIAKPYTLGELTESVSALLGSPQVSGRAV